MHISPSPELRGPSRPAIESTASRRTIDNPLPARRAIAYAPRSASRANGPAVPIANNETPTQTVYWYTPELHLMMETKVVSNATTSEWEYIWFNGQPAVQIDSSTGDMAWYFNDHLGTPILQTDATAAEIWHVERDPYGTPFATTIGPTRHQPLAFPGQEQDGELSYNIFRWYRAGWGRYTQADPAWSPVRIRDTHYSYASNSPLNALDPTGLFTIDKSGCKCLEGVPAGGDQDATRWQAVEHGTLSACLELDTMITNPQLRKCLKKRCESGRIACDQKCGQDTIAWAVPFFKTANLCVNNIDDWDAGYMGRVVIHEWAHTCGWMHGGGDGVPGNDGSVE
jgi:RHS repeat-associated protein